MTADAPFARLHWPLTALLLAACLLLGGGQGTLGDSACQLLALGILALVAWRHRHQPGARLPRVAWLAALPFLLPLLQLLPLPAWLWSGSPARAEIAVQLASVDLAPVHRGSLVPLATERALLWLLPAAALFLSALQFGRRERRKLLAIVVAVAVLGMVLGLAQMAGGPDSMLRPYAVTNRFGAVGFFANRNHQASLLVMCLPLVLLAGTAWLAGDTRRASSPWAWGLMALAAILLLVGVAVTNSRAGVLLGALALVLCLPGVMLLRGAGGARRLAAGAVVVGLALGLQFGLLGILQRFQADPLEDSRLDHAATTLQAAAAHAPLGAGLGGFRRAFEAFDVTTPDSVYVNHAHNDYLELWLDGGWLAVALALPLLVAFVAAGVGAWRRHPDEKPGHRAMRQAAWLALLLVALHSFGDYPLRTTALLAVAGLLAGCLRRPVSRRARPPAEALPQ